MKNNVNFFSCRFCAASLFALTALTVPWRKTRILLGEAFQQLLGNDGSLDGMINDEREAENV